MPHPNRRLPAPAVPRIPQRQHSRPLPLALAWRPVTPARLKFPGFVAFRMPVAAQSKLTLAFILVTILLDMIGLGIILPVLPQLIGELTGGTVAEAAVIGGYMVFFYS